MSIVPDKPYRRILGRAPEYGDRQFVTLKLMYGGRFIYYPRRTYEGGDLFLIDFVSPGSLCISDLDRILEECGLHGITLLYRNEEWISLQTKENLDALIISSIDKGCPQVVLYCDYVPIEFSCWGTWISKDHKILGEQPQQQVLNVQKPRKIRKFKSKNYVRMEVEAATGVLKDAEAYLNVENARLLAPPSNVNVEHM